LLTAGIDTAYIDPGKPWQNGLDESFNGKFRDECLSLEWFRTRPEAAVVIESWRQHFNEVRPPSSLGQLTPAGMGRRTCDRCWRRVNDDEDSRRFEREGQA
jgi:putative transposase